MAKKETPKEKPAPAEPKKNIPAPKKNKKKGKSMLEEYTLNAGCRGGKGGCSSADGFAEWVKCPEAHNYSGLFL